MREEAFKEGKAWKREDASGTKGTQKDKYKSERYPWITTDWIHQPSLNALNVVRNINTLSSVCPWLLLEVMAKHTLTGNCFLVNSKGSVLSSGLKGIRGIVNWFPLYGPMANSAMITELFSCFTKYLAPLTWPFAGSKLQKSMIGVPGLSSKMWGGSEDKLTEFKNCWGYFVP